VPVIVVFISALLSGGFGTLVAPAPVKGDSRVVVIPPVHVPPTKKK
jgi:hypothetical protein